MLEDALSFVHNHCQQPRSLEILNHSAFVEKLILFSQILQQWNKTIRLTGRDELAALAFRHLADSLIVLDHFASLPPEARCLDIGSGAGFPAIPLALAFPEQPWYLLESDQRRAAFLKHLRIALHLPQVTVQARRFVGSPQQEGLELPFARITFRAVAPETLLPHLPAYLTKEGMILYWGTPQQAPKCPPLLCENPPLLYTLPSGEHFACRCYTHQKD
jgi:16S rRNA (guanine527-N7)-methyltransferase